MKTKDIVHVSEPVVVTHAPPQEKRWGYCQFPLLAKGPDGRLRVIVNEADDHVSGYGKKPASYVAEDDGNRWSREETTIPVTSPNPACSSLFNGEYLVLSSVPAFEMKSVDGTLPPPLAEANCYGPNRCYRLADCPPAVQAYCSNMTAFRWTPTSRAWTQETVAYDRNRAVVWTRDPAHVPRTWIERPLLKHKSELLWVDYRSAFLNPDGTPPLNYQVSLMVSADNGRSFKYRSQVAADPTGIEMMGEPMLCHNRQGELVCIVRKTDHRVLPMCITYSKDDGHTWEQPKDLFDRGVFPGIAMLGGKVMLLSYGRPGVWLSASPDGSGRDWAEPMAIIENQVSIPNQYPQDSCSYTDMIEIEPGRVIMVYSDFKHRNAAGETCKAIKIVEIRLR